MTEDKIVFDDVRGRAELTQKEIDWCIANGCLHHTVYFNGLSLKEKAEYQKTNDITRYLISLYEQMVLKLSEIAENTKK